MCNTSKTMKLHVTAKTRQLLCLSTKAWRLWGQDSKATYILNLSSNDEQFASCSCCTTPSGIKNQMLKVGYVSRREDLVHYSGSRALWPFQELSAGLLPNSQSLDTATIKLLKSYTGFLLFSRVLKCVFLKWKQNMYKTHWHLKY